VPRILFALVLAAALPAGAQSPDLTLTPPSGLPPQLEPARATARPANQWLPVTEVVGYTFGMNLLAQTFTDNPDYDISWETFTDNLDGPWWYDTDAFITNQFAHPYEGSIYFSTSRTLGHGFWVSSIYAFGGSMLWEIAAESQPPSINDQITTTVAGTFLGEILYRLADIWLYPGGGNAKPGGWREFGGWVVNPTNGFNRLWYGDGYRDRTLTGYPTYGELRLTLGFGGRTKRDGVTVADDGSGIAFGVHMQHGLPAGDWEFEKPFDHFDVAADLVVNSNSVERDASANFTIRGLLLGTTYGTGAERGLWGLFGQYDYLVPADVFRVSSSSLGIGTTGQFGLGGGWAIQGTAIASLGYGAGGQYYAPEEEAEGFRDYHFGVQATGLLQAFAHWRDRVRIGLTARQYFISGKVTPDEGSWEYVSYGALNATYRIAGRHALSAQVTGARRRALYVDHPEINQQGGQVYLSYAYVTDTLLGLGRE
jgi:hypothetical protein